MQFLFEHVPVRINGSHRVESVTFNTPNGEKTIDCGLVVTAIGYQIDGAKDLPIESGKVVNQDGHVKDNLYVVGWAKRGPSGVIGTNKSDAAEVMNLLVSKLSEIPKEKFDLNSMLHARVVSQPIWEMINTAEISAGEALGKPRLKAVSREELLGLGGI
jgi:ferredoxin--NADP+ reductase